jgi:hypothetical protein
VNLAQLIALATNTQRSASNNISVGVSASKLAHAANVTTTAVTTQATGSTFVVFAGCYPVETAFTITDNKGNMYTLVGSVVSNVPDTISAGMYICVNGVGGSGHTFEAASSGSYNSIYAVELKGVATSSPQDGHAMATSVTSNDGPYVSGNITTTNANDILIAFCLIDAETYPQSGTANTLTLLGSLATTATGLGISCATGLETSTVTQQGSFSAVANGTYGICGILALKSS